MPPGTSLDNWRYLRTHGALEDLIRLGVRHQGAWFAGVSEAGSEVDLFNSIQWPNVQLIRGPDRARAAHDLSADGVRCASGWSASCPARRRRIASSNRWRDSATKGLIPLQLGPEGQAMLSCILKSDGNRGAWRREVRESFEVANRGDWAVANAIDRTLREHRLLAPLFVNADPDAARRELVEELLQRVRPADAAAAPRDPDDRRPAGTNSALTRSRSNGSDNVAQSASICATKRSFCPS